MSTTTVTCAGSPVSVYVGDTIIIDDKINARSTGSFTVVGTVAAQLSQGMAVTITDSVRGTQFTGTIDSITLSRITPNNTYLWQVVLKDGHYKADKRLWTGAELSGYAAGDAVAIMHAGVLAAEGVTASYAMDADDDIASWSACTLTNTIAASDGTLQLAAAGTPFLIAENTQAQWAAGTLTGVVATNGLLQLKSTQALKMTGIGTAGRAIGTTNLYDYFAIWQGSVATSGSDTLKYDIWVDSRSPLITGGIDLICDDGTTLSTSACTDLSGIPATPASDLSGYANDTWYHREISMSGGLGGKNIVACRIALAGNSSGSYTFYVRHVQLWSSGTVKQVFYNGGAMSFGQQQSKNGFDMVTVAVTTTYEASGQRISPVYTNSVCSLVRQSFAYWNELDPPVLKSGSASYPPPVLMEASFDNGATWTTLTNATPVPLLLPGMPISGTSWLIRNTLSVAGPSPEVTPTIDNFTLSVTPAVSTTVGGIDDADKVSDSTLAEGTLTNLTLGSTALGITGWIHSFASGDLSGMSTFGFANPAAVAWHGGLGLSCDSKDCRNRLDFVGNIKNFTLDVDVQLQAGARSNIGIVYRTHNWGVGNNYAYSVSINSTALGFSYGTDNATTDSDTNIASASLSFSIGQWYHLQVVVNNNFHQIWVDGVRYIHVNDSTYPGTGTAGMIGLRFYNNSGANASGYFDGLAISPQSSSNVLFTGSRVHPSLSLNALGIVGPSLATWDAVVPSNGGLDVQASIDGGTTWQSCTNGGPIPQLPPGTSVAGKSLLIQELFTAGDATATPLLSGIHIGVYGQFSATGTALSPTLALGSVGRAGSTSFTWDAVTPPLTTVTAITGIQHIGFAPIESAPLLPGAPITGINSQPDQSFEDFEDNDSADFTSTFQVGGAAMSATWDTANSRLILSGGTNAILAWTGGNAPATFSDGTLTLTTNQADALGLLARYVDTTSFYRLSLCDSLSSTGTVQTVTLYRRAASVTTQLTQGAITFSRGAFHTVVWQIIGAVHTVTWDGVQIFSYTDASPLSGPGICGFFTSSVPASNIYSLVAQPLGDDLTGTSAYSKLTLTSTDPTVSPSVISATLSARSPHLMTGAVLAQTAYTYKAIASNYDDAAKQSNYWWMIDQNGALWFQSRPQQIAAWPLWSGLHADGSCDILYGSQPQVLFASPLYRNRQYIEGAYDLVVIRDLKVGDGITTSWALSAPVSSFTSVTVGGVLNIDGTITGAQPRTDGVQGIDTGRDFYYTEGSVTVAQDKSEAALAPGILMAFTYTGIVPYTAMAQSIPQQTLLASLDGSTGIVEVSESGTGLIRAAADALAQARITQYAQLTKGWTYSTLRPGLSIGTVQAVFAPEFGFNDDDMLIVEIKQTITLLASGQSFTNYDVTCSEGPPLGPWSRIFVLN